MRELQTQTSRSMPTIDVPVREELLDLDADVFARNFARRPFVIRHHLGDHPLFALPRLMELARRLPEADIEYNAGDIPMSIDPKVTPRNGLSPEETVRRIAECKSWLVMKYVENDPEYRALLHACLAEVRTHSEAIAPGMMQAQGFIFVTSPNSVTPYHMDPEHNFLLQIRGSKYIEQFDGNDRSILAETELEDFYAGAHRNLTFKEEYRARAFGFDLEPGMGLHFPVTFPHWVKNGPSVSISFSITFRTPDLEKRAALYALNAAKRRAGKSPAPVGQHPWHDTLRYQSFRVLRKLKHVFGGKG